MTVRMTNYEDVHDYDGATVVDEYLDTEKEEDGDNDDAGEDE